ncbi:NAD-dependent epimerase/dehydratase family protein [Parafrigoribacterium mesophilum]|uniref:NAD-dependent epimerase/dehydratase family protein n=1 Tax=Parafrigoribacterium mesophilum TaxID=433646 RepID=UPI0031FCC521
MTRTLILGGTAWLGREIAERLVTRGEDVTCLARGESGEVPSGVTFVRADRRHSGAYDAVKGSDWDEIIELTYQADLVTGALDASADNTQHWTLISSGAASCAVASDVLSPRSAIPCHSWRRSVRAA